MIKVFESEKNISILERIVLDHSNQVFYPMKKTRVKKIPYINDRYLINIIYNLEIFDENDFLIYSEIIKNEFLGMSLKDDIVEKKNYIRIKYELLKDDELKKAKAYLKLI